MFFFKKKMGRGSSIKEVCVKFYTHRYLTDKLDQGRNELVEGNSVSFISSNGLLSENKDDLKQQISLYQILTGSDYHFKTLNTDIILEKENKDGSVIKYLRFRLNIYGKSGDTLYGYISQDDLSKEQEGYKMYLSTSYSDIEIKDTYYTKNGVLIFAEDMDKYIPITDWDDDIGLFCYIGINTNIKLGYKDLNRPVGNISPSIEEDPDSEVLLLKLYTNPWL